MRNPDEQVVPLVSLAQGRTPVDTFRRPIHDLRISVMDRCNFRCPYCMPEGGTPPNGQIGQAPSSQEQSARPQAQQRPIA